MKLEEQHGSSVGCAVPCAFCGDELGTDPAGPRPPACDACRKAEKLLAWATAYRRDLVAAGFSEAAAKLARLHGRLLVLREVHSELCAIGDGETRLDWNRRAIRRAESDLEGALALRRGAVSTDERAA